LNTLRGTYVFTASGFTLVAGVAQPKAIVEAINFNGDGTLLVPFATRSINGVVARTPGGAGTYTVDASCSGTIAFNPGPGFDIFISPRGEKIWMIQTDSGNVFEGTTENTSSTDQLCSNETLKGSYGGAIGGTRPAPAVIAGAAGFQGQLEQAIGLILWAFDGKGGFTQSISGKGSISGPGLDVPVSGTYSVNANCTATVKPTIPGLPPGEIRMVIVDGGKEFQTFVVSPQSSMVVGHARKVN
jgi:hypothetical protein